MHAARRIDRRCSGLVASAARLVPPSLPPLGLACDKQPAHPGPELIGSVWVRPAGQVGSGSPAPTEPDQATSPAPAPLYQLFGACEPSARISCRSSPKCRPVRRKAYHAARPCAQLGLEALLSSLDRGPASPA